MKIETYIDSLVSYAMNTGLADPLDHQVLTNRLLDILRKDDYEPSNETQREDLADAIVAGRDIAADKVLSKHAPCVEELKKQYTFTEDNTLEIILQETGKVFAGVLEDAGVYKNTAEGRSAFLKFVDYVNRNS